MAWELLTETPALLKPGHVVHFGQKWPAAFAEKWFRVAIAQEIKYSVSKIVGPNATYDLDFTKPASGGVNDTYLSLLPENAHSLYEILMGIKGPMTVYPRYNNSFFLKLETALCQPDPTDSRLWMLGGYTADDSPFASPRLREHTVHDQTPPQLRLFNPQRDNDKGVFRFIVNRCKVEEIKNLQTLSEQEKRVARELKEFEVFTW